VNEKTESTAYILDSFALLAYYQAEKGGARVRELLAKAENQQVSLFVSIINWGEVVYTIERRQGLKSSQEMIWHFDHLSVEMTPADRKLTLAAAHIKAHYSISYADAFAVALAQLKQGTILTGDPEFHKVEEMITIEWLPQQ
jgi:ribonuclease VapC